VPASDCLSAFSRRRGAATVRPPRWPEGRRRASRPP